MVMYNACTNIFSPYRIKLSQWRGPPEHWQQGQPKLAVRLVLMYEHICAYV